MRIERILVIIVLVSILCVSFLLNVAGINWGVPSRERNNLYFSDENQIKQILAGVTSEKVLKSKTQYENELSGSRFNPIRSYHPDESQFIESISNMNPKKFDFNPHYFWYGTLYFWFLGFSYAIAYIAGYVKLVKDIAFFYLNPDEIARFYIAGRMVSVIFGVLGVAGIFLAVRKMWDEKKALISAVFLAVAPIFVINSHYIAVDITEVFFVILTFYFSVNIFRTDKVSNYVLAGISAGLACSSKYTGILIVLSIPFAHFLRNEFRWKNLLICWFNWKVIIGYLSAVIAFIITCPFIITANSEVMSYIMKVQGRGNFIEGMIYYMKDLYHGFGAPLLALSAIGFVFSAYKRNKTDMLILFCVIIQLLFFLNQGKRLDRYILAVVPFLVMFAVRGLDIFGNVYLKICVLFIALFPTFLFCIGYDMVFMQENTRTTAGRWIAENIPAGTKIGLRRDPYQFETPPINMQKYDVSILRNDFGSVADSDVELLKRERPEYFILNEIERNVYGPKTGWEKWFEEGEYKLLKVFSNSPRILGIPFNDRNPSEDYLYFYPRIYVYKKLL